MNLGEPNMLAYKQQVVVQNPQQVVLSNLPVMAGQQVEVLILVEEEASATTARQENLEKRRQLFSSHAELFARQQLATTSSLEHLRAIRDEE
jgi:adenylate kinase